MIDLNTALQIIQIVSVVGGGGLVAFRLGQATQLQAATNRLHSEEIAELKAAMKDFAKVVTELAVQGNRLDMLDQRYEELRHGEGYVFPMIKGRTDVR
jgi:hypothetical protein